MKSLDIPSRISPVSSSRMKIAADPGSKLTLSSAKVICLLPSRSKRVISLGTVFKHFSIKSEGI